MEALICDKKDRLSSRRYKLKDLTSASPSFAGIASSSRAVPGSSNHNAAKDFSGRYVFPNDAEDIKSHKWFRGIPWDHLHQIEPPFVPRIRSVDDTHYFDEEEEISDWSNSVPTDTSDETTPTMPHGTVATHSHPHHHHPVGPASNPLAATTATTLLSPPHAPDSPRFHNPALTPKPTVPTTALPLPYSTLHPAPILPTHAPHRPAKEEEARLLLRGLRRSVQRWALAAIASPHDSAALLAQIDALTGLDPVERARLRHFVRVFGRRDRKRPRDRLLRDRGTKGVVMEERRKTAFLGYTWRRIRPVGEGRQGAAVGMGMGVRQEVAPAAMRAMAPSGGVDGMFEREREGLHYGYPGYTYVGGVAAGGGFGEEYDYGYGSGWSAWGGRGGRGAPHWENVSSVRALHGKGRFSWR
jgi:hypothetical protein